MLYKLKSGEGGRQIKKASSYEEASEEYFRNYLTFHTIRLPCNNCPDNSFCVERVLICFVVKHFV
jgi:hypothetical protein